VTNDAFNDRDILLGYYAKQADEFRLRHTAIWEEIRHYTGSTKLAGVEVST
jgi:hypothetical protein